MAKICYFTEGRESCDYPGEDCRKCGVENFTEIACTWWEDLTTEERESAASMVLEFRRLVWDYREDNEI